MDRLSKNFIWMAAANIVSGLFSAALFIYLARTLMSEAFGYFSYAQTLVFYIANFLDLGLSTYGIREAAKNKDRISEYVSEIVSFKLIAGTILYISFLVPVAFWSHSGTSRILLLEFGLFFFAQALATEWAFQSIEKLQMLFISFVMTNILQLGLALIFLKGPADLFKAPLLFFLAALPIIVIFLRRLKFKFYINRLDIKRMRGYLASSIVIWSISIFAQVYNTLDIVMLGFFRSIGEVGCYTVARKGTGAITLFMISLANTALPRLSAACNIDTPQFNHAIKRFLQLAFILTIILLLPIIIFSRQLITITVGGEYAMASIPLKIMAAALILVLFNLPFSTGLVAACLEKEVLKQVGACACFSIVSNLILMPRYGIFGASISFFMTEVLALAWILFVYNRRIIKKSIA